jgi:hypothetical protein
MGLRIKIGLLVLGLVFLVVVLRQVRQNKFRPFPSVLWVVVSLFLLSVAALEPFYKWLADSVVGIADARHIIYIGVFGFLLSYNLYLTVLASRMSNQIRHLISSLAILNERLGNERNPVGHSGEARGQTTASSPSDEN